MSEPIDLHAEVKKAGGLVSLADIARRVGVSHTAARKWRDQPDWPAPLGTIAEDTQQPVEVFLVADFRKWYGQRQGRIGRAAAEPCA